MLLNSQDHLCYCHCLDYGARMVLCDGVCGEHFHAKCIEPLQTVKKWYCKTVLVKY